ncbi:MAG TPA: septal ring lytic transglycosylase RlpA family protein [Solirubrobacteraceae bacterium]|nr:septal ring lytic transglycosylase RlpA family protein [Solirubrobacteraceae bacterium]
MKSLKGRRLLLCAAAAAFAAPAAAAGDPPSSGGAEAPPPPATDRTVTAQGAQLSVTTRAGTMLRKLARFRGTAEPGRTVAIERLDSTTGAWDVVATTAVAADGTFVARWRGDRVGEHRVRAVLATAGQAVTATATPELAITVHRPAVATWYGPGFYGRRTACGQRMSRTLLGVAHKTLPCGTQVAVLYKGRRITVPVVDRGPFRHGTTWDLTVATAEALRFEHTDRVGAVRVRAAQ